MELCHQKNVTIYTVTYDATIPWALLSQWTWLIRTDKQWKVNIMQQHKCTNDSETKTL